MSTAELVLRMSWISKFVMIWLMILRVIPRNDLFSWGIFLALWIISMMTTATIVESRKHTEIE